MTFGTQGKFPTTFACLLALIIAFLLAAAHNKAVQGWIQISAARVKMNIEEVFEQWLDMEEENDDVIVVVRVRIRT